MLRRLILVLSLLLCQTSWSGIVNSPQSYPFSDMNRSGDFLLIGDWRMIVYWEGRFLVVPHSSRPREDQVFSGGIAERPTGEAAALLCDGRNAYLFKPTRKASAPSGYVEKIFESSPSGGAIRCSMDRDGNWAILDLLTRTIMSKKGGEQYLEQTFRYAWLQHIGRGLMILTDGQDMLVQYEVGRQWTVKASPFARFHEKTRFLARAGRILYQSDFHLQTATYQKDTRAAAITVDSPQRIRVSPCSDEQICGMSLADDGSWLVAGYWATYMGYGRDSQRLPHLLETGRTAGSAISHSSREGQFIFTGPYDGDWGSMQDLQRQSLRESEPFYSPWEPVDIMPVRGGLGKISWMDEINLAKARDYLKALSVKPAPVLLAVIDSGVTIDHPRLSLSLRLKDDELSNGRDDDDNGFIDDRFGFDFIQENARPQDSFGHGSHVAGLLASTIDGHAFSPADNAQLVVARALDRSGKSNALDLARAIYYAVDEGAEILNLSWGGGRPSFALADAIAYAHRHGLSIFTSAGNDRLDHDVYPQVPGMYRGVISVGATDPRGRLAGFSNYGAQTVDFLAPGTDILSSLRDGELGLMSGTSMAAPLVASSYAWLLGISKALWPLKDPREHREQSLRALCQSSLFMPQVARCGLIQLDKAVAFLIAEGSSPRD